MFTIIPTKTNYDFMGTAPKWTKISLFAFVASLVVIFILPSFTPIGLKLGLDFTGGHEIVLRFKNPDISPAQVRESVAKLNLGDSSVQAFGEKTAKGVDFLVRVQRAQTLTDEDIKAIENAFSTRYGNRFKPPVGYNKEMGSVIEVEFTDSSTAALDPDHGDLGTTALTSFVSSQGRAVRKVTKVGRPDQARFAIMVAGIDDTIVRGLSQIDPDVTAERVEFVGPTVGKQLRDDGILAVLYALLCILIYVALRFDFYYSPGAVLCLFHDAFITTAVLALVGREFTLTTIAGLLTLVGYSINDTIIIFDRIRELVGKAQGKALAEVINRAVNETLGRTIMTSTTVLMACVCLCVFGSGTVLFEFGLILGIGVIIGSYSSIFVASPIFMWLREKYAPKFEEVPEENGSL